MNKQLQEKYVLRIKIITNQEFTLETLTLVDMGAGRNIISGLIPTRYYEKMTQALSTVNDQCLKIKYKLSNTVVCIKNVSIYLTFILVYDSGIEVILGNFALIEPFTIDDTGIHIKIKDKEVTFNLEFPKRKILISSLKEKPFRKMLKSISLMKKSRV